MMNLQFQSINQNHCFGKTCVSLLTEICERLPGEKAWPPQTGNAGCLWWTPACSHHGHWRIKAKTSIRHQMSRLLIDIYIYIKDECDTATNKHEKQRGNLVSFTFFLFVLNCKMQSIKIDNMHKWHK